MPCRMHTFSGRSHISLPLRCKYASTLFLTVQLERRRAKKYQQLQILNGVQKICVTLNWFYCNYTNISSAPYISCWIISSSISCERRSRCPGNKFSIQIYHNFICHTFKVSLHRVNNNNNTLIFFWNDGGLSTRRDKRHTRRSAISARAQSRLMGTVSPPLRQPPRSCCEKSNLLAKLVTRRTIWAIHHMWRRRPYCVTQGARVRELRL